MTLLSQTIAFVAMAASLLWSRAVRPLGRRERRGGRECYSVLVVNDVARLCCETAAG